MLKLADNRYLLTLLVAACLISMWLVRQSFQHQRNWILQSETLQDVQLTIAHSTSLLGDEQINLSALLTSLQQQHHHLVALLGVLEFGDPATHQPALAQWPTKVESLTAAAQTVFAALGALSDAEHQMTRTNARQVALQRDLQDIGDSLTQFFASSLSVDLTPAQLRLFYQIFFDIRQWQNDIATISPINRTESHTTLSSNDRLDESIDALLAGDQQIANLALRRHIANLRLRLQEQRTALTLLQEERQEAHSIGDRRDDLQTELAKLDEQADTLMTTAYAEWASYSKRTLASLLSMIIIQSLLCGWYTCRTRQASALSHGAVPAA